MTTPRLLLSAATRLRITGVAAVAMLTLPSCRGSSTAQDDGSGREVVCTADFRYGLNVAVLDAATGAPIPRPLFVVASDGSYADTSQAARDPGTTPGFASWPLAGERAGRYTVRVRATGYQEWQQDGVVVSRDVCHVVPVSLTARLTKLP